MTIIWPLLLLILINSLVIEAYSVLVFNNTQSLIKQDPSYAFLAKDVYLPEKFTLCSSIKQARFDDVGFFTIHAQDSQEWLEMEFESFSKETKLTVRQGRDIHRIGKLPNPRLDYWYHIWLGVDLKESKTEVVVIENGLAKLQSM